MEEVGSPQVRLEACLGCGACVSVCPAQVLSLSGGRAAVARAGCIGCGHCAAVCPVGAIRADTGDGWAEDYTTFTPSGKLLAPGEFPPADLADLLRSRRSCRAFRSDEVPGPLLEDLIRLAVTAPSGTNSQAWTFTALTSRAAVMAVAEGVADFFRRLNRLAARSFLRRLLAWCGRRALEDYYRTHYSEVRQALTDWERAHKDRLFYDAPAALLIGSRPGASCPVEDAMLAAGNVLLAARSMGLGTCLIGYAVAAMEHDRRVLAAAGVPAGERVHAVIALGWPAVRFVRPVGRRRPVVRYKTA